MAAPEGNRFWELRSKHGRDTLFATPELMWEAAVEYFQHQIENPWIKEDWVGKNARKIERKTTPPFTITGLCLYLGCNTKYFTEFKQTCNDDFSEVITRIEQTIYTQKFEGATVGAYNANIIARDLGLVDKSEQKVDAKTNAIDYDKLSDSALEEIAGARSR